MFYRVEAVKPLANLWLGVRFRNGVEKRYDVKPYIRGSWYGELENPSYFKSVFANGYTVEWADGQDICPDELYDNSVAVPHN